MKLTKAALSKSRMDYLRHVRRYGYAAASISTGKLGLAQDLVASGHLLVSAEGGGSRYFVLTDAGRAALTKG